LLNRYGVVTREATAAENIPGSFSSVYDILKAMEDSGKVRRGYFISGVAATQFGLPAAVDLLRAMRTDPDMPDVHLLAATDPANPYGGALKWPKSEGALTRSVGAQVIIVNGGLACYISRGWRQFHVFLPEEEPTRTTYAEAIAQRLAAEVTGGRRRAVLVEKINGAAASDHPLAPYLAANGFTSTAFGYHLRSATYIAPRSSAPPDDDEDEDA
jgi:ATP-dependent Lhr-like helicase